MSFLEGLHGTVAAVLICTLLLVDEAGVPLPFAPSEVLLLLTGVLIGPWGHHRYRTRSEPVPACRTVAEAGQANLR